MRGVEPARPCPGPPGCRPLRSRRHYNDERPHSSLDYLTPNEFRNKSPTPSTTSAVARVR
ncbi:MAG: integrase core domain-containing protein [Polyangiales bacterium]